MLNLHISNHSDFRVKRNQYNSMVAWLIDNIKPSGDTTPPAKQLWTSHGIDSGFDDGTIDTWFAWRGEIDHYSRVVFVEYRISDEWMISFATIKGLGFEYTYEIAMKVDDSIAVQLWLLFPHYETV